MNGLLRSFLVLLVIILLGVSIRLLYYGLQISVYVQSGHTTSGSYLPSPLIFAIGIILFVAGLALGIFALTPHYEH